ncbi:hypothetical protein EDC18_10573 [Natranaerovirga pectinivora]|uniref:Uncharacterized protein n=1 Tax=Natranaerovirga pectinivora TaxID=682400 RepID=A0A4R3MN31_9FIRM|nr:hypothetical protein [Natranaerovirga pectinivora]TCT14592.1 hypothetical protein EDC18_10573 [Natranaerovirga pectinivora]
MGINNKKLPDTPWHIGYAVKEEDDPRRHRARCVYYDNSNKKCITHKSRYFMVKCGGSAHCNYYSEKLAVKKETAHNNKLDYNNQMDDRTSRLKKKKEFMDNENLRIRQKSIKEFKVCPICKLELSQYTVPSKNKKNLNGIQIGKKCFLCSVLFIDKDYYEIYIKKIRKSYSDICIMKLRS